jgi:hypothetical protein
MAKYRLAAGVDVDLLTSGELRKELDAHARKLRRMLNDRPIPRTPQASATLDSNGLGTVNLGNPSAGRQWDVRRVNVCGQVPSAAFAGTAVIYRGSVGPLSFVDSTATLPNVSTWSAEEFTLRPDESIIVQVTGGLAGAVMFVSAQVMDGPKSQLYEVDLPDELVG